MNGRPAYHIIVEGRTAGTFDVFYKVRNRYESYVDQQTLLPYFYAENRHEGNWKHTDKVTFDQVNDKITAGKGTFPFKGKVFDFVSAYYFARNLDISKIKVGDHFVMRYFLDDGINSLGITYAGKEKVTCALGTFNCLKFNPTILPGRIFKKNSKLYLWITDDANRIPVKAHVEVVVGSVSMDLTGRIRAKIPFKPDQTIKNDRSRQYVLVHEDVVRNNFVCNLNKCKGACCLEGDSGAPLDADELDTLNEIYPKVKPYMTASGHSNC